MRILIKQACVFTFPFFKVVPNRIASSIRAQIVTDDNSLSNDETHGNISCLDVDSKIVFSEETFVKNCRTLLSAIALC